MDKLWNRISTENNLFSLRILFSILLAALVGGILFAAILFISEKIPFQGNVGLFLLPVMIIVAGVSLLLFYFFNRQNHLLFLRSFSKAKIDLREQRILLRMIKKRAYHEFEEIALQNLKEQLLSTGEEIRSRLYALRQFGIVVPAGQQEKILEDERFHALLGIEKDAFIIALSVPGLESYLSGVDEDVSISCRKTVFKSVVRFAAQNGLLLPDFNLSCSALYYGLPYESVAPDVIKLAKSCGRWCKSVNKSIGKTGYSGEALALIAHGSFLAGLVETSGGAGYVVGGELVDEVHSLCIDASRHGVLLHSSLEESGEAETPCWVQFGK